MTRTTNPQPESNKRKHSTLSSDDSEPKQKSTKIQNSKGQKTVNFSSYSSRIFNIDVQNLLSGLISTTQSDIFFNYRRYRDEMFKIIIKNYEESLMNETRFGTTITTHANMHIKNNFQHKRNQCKVVSEPNMSEMYLCVHSDEFKENKNSSLNDPDRLECDGWLIYRCEEMKQPKDGYTSFQTKSTMKGNKTDTKSFHWLGIQGSFCTIKKLDCTVNEVRDELKGKAIKYEVSLDCIKEELNKSIFTPMITMIPFQMASELKIQPVWELESLSNCQECIQEETEQSSSSLITNVVDTGYEGLAEVLPVQCPKEMIWTLEGYGKSKLSFDDINIEEVMEFGKSFFD